MRINISELSANQRYYIVHLLLQTGSPGKTRSEINRLARENPELGFKEITRWVPTRVLSRAAKEKKVVQLAELDEGLADEIAAAYQLDRERLRVVDVRHRKARRDTSEEKEREASKEDLADPARDAIADTAAQVILGLIDQVARSKPGQPVHLGFAGGDLVWAVARALGVLLRDHPRLPKLVLHALTAGFDPERPRTDPNAFVTHFDGVPTEVTYRCLYSTPFVPVSGYRRVLESEGVRSSYEVREKIDIAITGMGSADDPHSQLQRFHASASCSPDRSWIGEVGLLPYGASGPARRSKGMRGVALFELGKYVVLVAGACARCGRPKGAALRPLVAEPRLRCWTHLVFDLDCAQQLAAQPAQPAQPVQAVSHPDARRVRKAHRVHASAGRKGRRAVEGGRDV
jgi:DNA-binding transcriptional regulator LsrR (DeoR family)